MPEKKGKVEGLVLKMAGKKGKLEGLIFYVCELKPTDNLNIDRQSMTVEFSGSGGDEEKDLAEDQKLIVLVIAA